MSRLGGFRSGHCLGFFTVFVERASLKLIFSCGTVWWHGGDAAEGQREVEARPPALPAMYLPASFVLPVSNQQFGLRRKRAQKVPPQKVPTIHDLQLPICCVCQSFETNKVYFFNRFHSTTATSSEITVIWQRITPSKMDVAQHK